MIFLLKVLGLAVLACVTVPAWSQATEIQYDNHLAGDRALTIELGPMFPMAFQSFSGVGTSTGLSLGGVLGLDLDFYLNNDIRLGAGLKGQATSDVNNNSLFMVPITFRATWEPKVGHFVFPMTMAAGFTFITHLTSSAFDPTLMPEVGAYWNMNSSWSFGLSSTVWIVFQPYFSGGSVPTSDGRIGYFVDTALGTIYHF